MEANREEILLNFQACTGIDDVAEAIMWLDESNWDLIPAIRSALPQESQTLPSDVQREPSPQLQPVVGAPLIDLDSDDEMMPASMNGRHILTDSPKEQDSSVTVRTVAPPPSLVSICSDYADFPSTSGRRNNFTFIAEHNSIKHNIDIPENATVGLLKTKIYADTGVPICRQVITGWPCSEPPKDDVKLSSLNLSQVTNVVVASTNDSALDVGIDHSLNLRDDVKNKFHSLQSSSNSTVPQVKRMTDVPLKQQQWANWGSNVSDSTEMKDTGLQHNNSSNVKRKKKEGRTQENRASESEESTDDFEDNTEPLVIDDDEDEDEQMFVEDSLPQRSDFMIPPEENDEISGAIYFADSFTRRYGEARPEFFPGTLKNAIKEACMKPVKERRLLAIYLHHDKSVLSNVFCTQLLCFESVLQTLSAYFVVWGWDLTHERNRMKFMDRVGRLLGATVADTINRIGIDNLPALIIVTRSRSNTELFNVINGNTSVSELLTMLIHAVDVYTEMQRAETIEEEERAKREMIKTEQDMAYQESLLADRAKAEAKKQQEMMEKMEKERQEREKRELEEQITAERNTVKSRLPEEPPLDCKEGVIQVRIRIPAGEFLLRRFYKANKLQDVFDYLFVEGYSTTDFKVISSWPRQDLTTLSPSSTMDELKFHPQETLILEAR